MIESRNKSDDNAHRNLLRGAIQAALAHRAGDSPDAGAVVEAAIGIWEQIVAQLVPVIGVRGVDVLFRRAAHLESASYPWLEDAEEKRDGAAQLTRFRARLETQETAIAAEASCALLVTFTELLESLIGDSLTERLLHRVWALPLRASKKGVTR